MKNYFEQTLRRLKKKWAIISFIGIGLASTIWFLVRVIPKPSRAAYPCMRAAAPFMSTFILWVLGLGAGSLFFRRSLHLFRQARTSLALILLGASVLTVAAFGFLDRKEAGAAPAMSVSGDFPPNEPFGEALGIFPGRVSWYWNPEATREASAMTVNYDGVIDENDDVFFLRKNNNEAVVDEMMDSLMLNLTGESSLPDAWDAVFRYHNMKVHKKDAGYASGERIFIKTNNQGVGISSKMYSDLRQKDEIIWNHYPIYMTATSPYSILATLKHLVHEAGVPEGSIYVGDPHNNFNDIYYNIIREQFAAVHIIGVNANDVVDCVAHGRTLSVKGTEDIMFYSDKGEYIPEGSDKFYSQQIDADYIINIAALKGHIRGGITLFCKSHFGSHTRESAAHLHPGLVAPDKEAVNSGYGKYRVLTDLMGHRDLGGNRMLSILDALWGGPPHELHAPRKWDMAPFNGDWTSSLFVSLDPVAIASVAHDFLRTEYSVADWGHEAYPNYYGVDDYLHQAADSQFWPDGITYDPENDGTPIPSLGSHEHWNNAAEMNYSRNLDGAGGNGIELVKLHEQGGTGITSHAAGREISLYPNPVRNRLYLKLDNAYNGQVEVRVYAMNGQEVFVTGFTKNAGLSTRSFSMDGLDAGSYIIGLDMGGRQLTRQLLVMD